MFCVCVCREYGTDLGAATLERRIRQREVETRGRKRARESCDCRRQRQPYQGISGVCVEIRWLPHRRPGSSYLIYVGSLGEARGNSLMVPLSSAKGDEQRLRRPARPPYWFWAVTGEETLVVVRGRVSSHCSLFLEVWL